MLKEVVRCKAPPLCLAMGIPAVSVVVNRIPPASHKQSHWERRQDVSGWQVSGCCRVRKGGVHRGGGLGLMTEDARGCGRDAGQVGKVHYDAVVGKSV